jgi:hypothetical protein
MNVSVTSIAPPRTLQEVLSIKEDSTRHSIPISRDEIESMISYVIETRHYLPATHPEWDFSISSPEFNFIRRTDDTSNLFRTRSWIKLPRVPPQVLFHILQDPKQRMSFDKYYVRFESSRCVSSELDVVVSELDAPIGISNREFVEWRRQYVSDSTTPRKDCVYAIELRSCDDDQCSPTIRPRSKGLERAETWLSGYVITWWFDPDTRQVLGSEILVMSQIDMRGMLPQMFVNIVGALSAPTKWCRSLIEASLKFCKSSGIHVDMTDDDIESKLGIKRRVNNSS